MSDRETAPEAPAPTATSGCGSFEELLARLEGVVNTLEDGQTGLAESLARYEEGVQLLKQCYEQLARAERRVEQLLAVDESGQAVTAPFDDRATLDRPAANSGSERPARAGKSPRRGRNAPPSPGEEGESTGTLF